VLRKHRWLITGIFLLTVLTVGIWTFVQVPIYQAVTTILIEPEPPKVLNIQDVTPVGAMSPWDPAFYPTQYEIIKSRAVVERALTALNATKRAADGGAAADPRRAVPGSLAVDPMRNKRLVLIKIAGPDPRGRRPRPTLARMPSTMSSSSSRGRERRSPGSPRRRAASGRKSRTPRRRFRTTGSSPVFSACRSSGRSAPRRSSKRTRAIWRRRPSGCRWRPSWRAHPDRQGSGDRRDHRQRGREPLVGKIKGDIGELETQKSKLLKVYKDKHPEIVKVDAQIQHLQDRLEAAFQGTLRSVQTQVKVAKAREDTLFNEVTACGAKGRTQREGGPVPEPPARHRVEPAAL
jgi:hypothetical protein